MRGLQRYIVGMLVLGGASFLAAGIAHSSIEPLTAFRSQAVAASGFIEATQGWIQKDDPELVRWWPDLFPKDSKDFIFFSIGAESPRYVTALKVPTAVSVQCNISLELHKHWQSTDAGLGPDRQQLAIKRIFEAHPELHTIPFAERYPHVGNYSIPLTTGRLAVALYLIGCAALTLAAAIACCLAFTQIVSRSRRTYGHCGNCGYDTRGLPEAAPCPECGRSFDPTRQ